MYNKKRVGEIHTTNEGYELHVVKPGSKPHYCTVKIQNWTKEVTYGSVKTGAVKYPYHKGVEGNGYIGEGKFSRSTTPKVYEVWRSMLKRVFSPRENEHTYTGAVVVEEWLNLQTFGEWFERNYIEGFELDKDLLLEGNKRYGPETCVCIPKEINSFLTNKKSTNSSGAIGVSAASSGKWGAYGRTAGKSINLGVYNTFEEASEAYLIHRKKEAAVLKSKYKTILPEIVIDKIR